MYSDALMEYLFKYNLPKKEEKTEEKKIETEAVSKVFKDLKKAYVTVPIELHHEQG